MPGLVPDAVVADDPSFSPQTFLTRQNTGKTVKRLKKYLNLKQDNDDSIVSAYFLIFLYENS